MSSTAIDDSFTESLSGLPTIPPSTGGERVTRQQVRKSSDNHTKDPVRMRVSQVVSVRRRPGHGFGLIEFLVAAAIVALAVL